MVFLNEKWKGKDLNVYSGRKQTYRNVRFPERTSDFC